MKTVFKWKNLFRRTALQAASVMLALAAWYLLSVSIGAMLVPRPWTVMWTFIGMWRSGELFMHVGKSLERVVIGFTFGSLAAIFVGLLLARVRLFRELMDPIVELLRFLSPTAMISIAVIWFGIGEMSKYFLISWGTLFIVVVGTVDGAVRTPSARQNAARCLGASEAQIFFLIVLPSAIPSIVTGMRVALATAFFAIVPAELIAADNGLGYLLQSSSLLMQTDRIFVALVTISVVGFATDRIFMAVVSRLWRRFMIVA
jgi:ABC-type nitrate/sulfonate/bicarbonate transport system permease component